MLLVTCASVSGHSRGKVYDFSFREGLWCRSLRVLATATGRYVAAYDQDSLKVVNGTSQPETFDLSDPNQREDFEANLEKVIWAFENRKGRKDDRDTCVEVDLSAEERLIWLAPEDRSDEETTEEFAPLL